MSNSCSGSCSSCGEDCASRKPQSLIEPMNPDSNVKKVIAVVSGKGGVGKSLVTGLMTRAMQRKAKRTAILDADITGPSIPKIFGIADKRAGAEENAIVPVETKFGTKVMSINLLLQDSSEPVVWRGPVISGVVKQFWHDVKWGEVDYMFVDMPPGTGDVPLTVFQSLPINGIIIVTSPQDLVSMIVEKAVKMARLMDVPVLGIVENMSYFKCPECGKEHSIFGESHINEVAAKLGIDHIARIPIQPEVARLCDEGKIESVEGTWLDELADYIKDI